MWTRASSLGVLLVLATGACRGVGVEAVEAIEPVAVEPVEPPLESESLIESDLEAEPQPESEPEPDPKPAPEPLPKIGDWQPIAEPDYIQSDLLGGTETSARYALESEAEPVPTDDQLRYQLDLRVRDESTTLILTEFDTGHVLKHEWSTSLCAHRFYDGDGAGAALGVRAHDDRGRKLLELWVSCRLGEDIISAENLMLLVLVDAGGLSLLWKGGTWEHSSHVCGVWTQLGVKFEQQELVITETERGAIFEPESLPDYDCHDAREYEAVLGQQRVKLP